MPGISVAAKADGQRWALIAGLVLINVIWGGTFVVKRLALNSLGPVEIVALRFFIAAPLIVLITYLWKGGQAFAIDRKDLLPLAIMGLTGVTFQQILQVWAQRYTTATNSSLLANTAVFFSLFLSVLYLKERVRITKITGSVIGFAGVALLVMNMNGFLDLGGHVIGDGMILAAAFLWSIYMVVGKGVCSRYHPATVVTYVFTLGAIFLLPMYILTPHTPVEDIPVNGWAYVLFLAVVSSVFADLVLFTALERMEASSVTAFIYLIPLSTIVLAIIVLGESLTIMSAIGGFAILLGMYLTQKTDGGTKRLEKSPAPEVKAARDDL